MFRLKFDPWRATFRGIREEEAESIADEQRRTEEEAKRSKVREKIRRALRASLELNVRGLEKAIGRNKEMLEEVREEMVEAGLLLMRKEGQSKLFRLPDVH